jgi:phosphoribosylaminoimidazole (AIR) synthetase
MFRAFNMGIGLACIVSEDAIAKVEESFDDSENKPIIVGRVIKGQQPRLNLNQ